MLTDSLSTDTDTCISSKTADGFEDVQNERVTDFVPDRKKKRIPDSIRKAIRSFFQLPNNRRLLKHFGNKTVLEKERHRFKEITDWIIHPYGQFRFSWNCLMVVFLVITVVEEPIILSFFSDDVNSTFIFLHCVVDTLFLLDIAVNFRTGVMLNSYVDEIILTPQRIAHHYLKTWFLFDFLSSFPIDYFFLAIFRDTNNQAFNNGEHLKILKHIKILGLIRLLRIFRLVRYIQHLQEFLNISNRFVGTFNIVFLIILLSHWNACLQYLIPMLQDFPKDSWVEKCDLLKATRIDQYTWCLFNAVSHMLSIGYGRYPPTSASEAWLTIISVLTGVTCYALFVGHAAALIYSFDTSKRLYGEKFKQVNEYMSYMKLPRELRERIVNYYEYRYQGKIFNENNILNELSECLREEIINYNCRSLVASVPIFIDADPSFITDVVVKLKYEVFQPGDLIIKEGTIGTKMYFIQEGVVDVITRDKEVIAVLSNGSFFGEICLLTKSKRMASIMAKTHCSIYSLDRDSFHSVLDNYPLMRKYLERVAADRLIAIGKNPQMLKHRIKLQEKIPENYHLKLP